ncbi:MAG: transposase family protein, partial [Ketobacter sp.]|nr:transposase family protein [Ketobacter sp.]
DSDSLGDNSESPPHPKSDESTVNAPRTSSHTVATDGRAISMTVSPLPVPLRTGPGALVDRDIDVSDNFDDNVDKGVSARQSAPIPIRIVEASDRDNTRDFSDAKVNGNNRARLVVNIPNDKPILSDIDNDIDMDDMKQMYPNEPKYIADDTKYFRKQKEIVDKEIRTLLHSISKSTNPFDIRLNQLLENDWSKTINQHSLRAHLLNDVIYCTIIKILVEKNQSHLIYTLPKVFQNDITSGYYSMKHGLLYYNGRNDEEKIKHDNQIWKTWLEGYCIPPKLRKDILTYFHTSLSTNHQGGERMRFLMAGKVYWKGMIRDIRRFVSGCDTCYLSKQTPNRREGYMNQFITTKPFEIVHMDIVGPLPRTKSGNRYILTMMDRYSRMVKCICLPIITASAIASAVRNHWLLNFGTPEYLLSDRGSYFTGFIFKLLGKLSGFNQLFTSAYHPETNGRLERFHRFLKQRLRMIAFDRNMDFLSNHDWDNFIPNISFSYNITPNRMNKISPFDIIYGNRIKLPIERMLNRDISNEADAIEKDTQQTTGIRGSSGFKIDSTHRSYIDSMRDIYLDLDNYIQMSRTPYN